MNSETIFAKDPATPKISNAREEQIRKRAYELYLARNRPVDAVHDWLQAEAEITWEVKSLDRKRSHHSLRLTNCRPRNLQSLKWHLPQILPIVVGAFQYVLSSQLVVSILPISGNNEAL